MTTKEKIVLLTLNDNTKLEGVLVKIDKENLKIILGKGKVISLDGSTEEFDKNEIFKKDIKEIRLVEEKDKPVENRPVVIQNENKKEEIVEDSAFNAIPLDIQEKYDNENCKYERDGFFDGLKIANNKDNYKDIKTYNEKNKETFGLDDTFNNNGTKKGQRNYNHRRKRGGGNYRGRGGYNNHHGNNNNYHHHNHGNYHGHYNHQGYNNNQGRGGYGGHNSGRGGYNNNNYNQRGGGYHSGQYSSQYGVSSEMSSMYSGMTNENSVYDK